MIHFRAMEQWYVAWVRQVTMKPYGNSDAGLLDPVFQIGDGIVQPAAFFVEFSRRCDQLL